MYRDFAAFYDLLTRDVNYKERTEYLLKLFHKFDCKPSLLLDLACGTGGFSNEFAKADISVIGVDISPDMLNIARENSERQNLDVMYICQDAEELDLYGTVDGAICCLDSLNHITDYQKLCKILDRVSLFLEEDKLFIFDVNTLYKHESILGNNTFVFDEEDVYCVWSNEYSPENATTQIFLDFFVPDKEGKYERLGEEIGERVYSGEELENALQKAGLEVLAVYGEMTEEAPAPDCQRVVYITRKVKSNG